MYIPRHLIETNLYTNGNEFVLSNTSENYVGYYWRDAQNNYFTGRTPDDLPNTRLFTQPSEMDDDEHHEGITSPEGVWTTSQLPITETPPGQLPTRFFPNPSQDDYNLGEFQRYFAKKTNQNLYIEINEEQYNQIVRKDNRILWQLYIPILIPWQLDGTPENALSVNRATTQRVQQPGFEQYFKENFLEFHHSRLDNN